MTRNIYHAQKKLAIEFFLIKLLAHIAENLEDYSPYETIKKTRLGKFLMACNQLNRSGNIKNKEGFLREHYQHYKELCDYDVFALIKQLSECDDKHPATQIAMRLQHRQMPKILRLEHADLKHTAEALHEFKVRYKKQYADWQLSLIQTPHRSYSDCDDPILVINEQRMINPIGHFSMMINAISDKLEHVAFLCIDQAIAEDKTIKDFMKHLQAIPA